jgi:hypothetical protein
MLCWLLVARIFVLSFALTEFQQTGKFFTPKGYSPDTIIVTDNAIFS